VKNGGGGFASFSVTILLQGEDQYPEGYWTFLSHAADRHAVHKAEAIRQD
jgi:hypothetical protein